MQETTLIINSVIMAQAGNNNNKNENKTLKTDTKKVTQ